MQLVQLVQLDQLDQLEQLAQQVLVVQQVLAVQLDHLVQLDQLVLVEQLVQLVLAEQLAQLAVFIKHKPMQLHLRLNNKDLLHLLLIKDSPIALVSPCQYIQPILLYLYLLQVIGIKYNYQLPLLQTIISLQHVIHL